MQMVLWIRANAFTSGGSTQSLYLCVCGGGGGGGGEDFFEMDTSPSVECERFRVK